MKLDVVIPNYNGEKYLAKCIESVFAADLSGIDLTLIIIDNGSSDGSYKILKDFVSHYNIKLIVNEENTGFAAAVNKGIRLSDAEYVLLLNNDTVADRLFFRNLIYCIKKDERIFGVSSKMLQYHHPDLIDDAGDEYNILGWTKRNGFDRKSELYSESGQVFSACAGAALYRRSVFDEIGYFDESFFAYMEDVDISFRARIHGYINVYCADAVIYHIGSATSGSRYNAFKVKLSSRNNVYTAYKNMPLLQLILNLPFLLAGFLIKYIFFMKKGLGREYKDGIIEGISTLSKVEKVKFRFRNVKNYIDIQLRLIINTVRYFF